MSDPIDAWVEVHADALFRFAVARLADATTADDLVQETFIAALEARDSFRGEAAERTWLIGILRHKIIDHLRRRRREVPLEVEVEDQGVASLFKADGHWQNAPGAWEADPDDLARRPDFWQALQGCRDRLPGRQPSVLTLRLMEERPAEEICAVLGISENNLWVLLHRARTRLRACLEQHWFQQGPT